MTELIDYIDYHFDSIELIKKQNFKNLEYCINEIKNTNIKLIDKFMKEYNPEITDECMIKGRFDLDILHLLCKNGADINKKIEGSGDIFTIIAWTINLDDNQLQLLMDYGAELHYEIISKGKSMDIFEYISMFIPGGKYYYCFDNEYISEKYMINICKIIDCFQIKIWKDVDFRNKILKIFNEKTEDNSIYNYIEEKYNDLEKKHDIYNNVIQYIPEHKSHIKYKTDTIAEKILNIIFLTKNGNDINELYNTLVKNKDNLLTILDIQNIDDFIVKIYKYLNDDENYKY
jgi:hypothetical protein